MLFELRTRVGPRNHVGVHIPQWEGAILREGEGHTNVVKYRDTLRSSVQKQLNRLRCYLGCGLRWAQGIVLDGVQTPHSKG